MKCFWILIYLTVSFQIQIIANTDFETNNVNNFDLVVDPFNPNLLTLEVTLNKKNINMPIDISSDTIWIMRITQDDSSFSSSSLFNEQCIIPDNIQNDIQETSLSLRNIIYVEPITYINIKKNYIKCNYSSTLGLARVYSDKSFSLLDKLKKTNLCRFFSIGMNDTTKGTFSFSKLNYFPPTKRKIQFKAIDRGKKWGGIIEGVIIGSFDQESRNKEGTIIYATQEHSGDYYPLFSEMYFETIYRFIIVPHEVLEFIEKTMLNKKQCENHLIDQLSVYYCNKNKISQFEDIHFIIQGNVFTFHPAHLFEINNKSDEALFLIVSHLKSTQISFGHVFLSRYSIAFDTESFKISILSKNVDILQLKFSESRENKNSNKYYRSIIQKVEKLFIIAFMTSFAGIMLLLVSLFRHKQYILPKIINSKHQQ